MSRRRYRTLEELDGDHLDDFGAARDGTGVFRRQSSYYGVKMNYPVIGGVNEVPPALSPPPPRPPQHRLTWQGEPRLITCTGPSCIICAKIKEKA